jgi:hypothetical protein
MIIIRKTKFNKDNTKIYINYMTMSGMCKQGGKCGKTNVNGKGKEK